MTSPHCFLCMNIIAFIFNAPKVVKFSITWANFFSTMYSAFSLLCYYHVMASLGSVKLAWEAVMCNPIENSWHQQLDQETEQGKFAALAVLTMSVMTCSAIIFSSGLKLVPVACPFLSCYPHLFVGSWGGLGRRQVLLCLWLIHLFRVTWLNPSLTKPKPKPKPSSSSPHPVGSSLYSVGKALKYPPKVLPPSQASKIWDTGQATAWEEQRHQCPTINGSHQAWPSEDLLA